MTFLLISVKSFSVIPTNVDTSVFHIGISTDIINLACRNLILSNIKIPSKHNLVFWSILQYEGDKVKTCDTVACGVWWRGVVGITTAQLHLTKPELMFCTGSKIAHKVSEICNGENQINLFVETKLKHRKWWIALSCLCILWFVTWI